MYNDLDKKFDLATKKALPYLVLAPPIFRKELSELMEALFHQLLQRSESDFDTHYAQVNDMIDNRKKFESNLEVRIQHFARRFVSQEETISLIDRQLVKLEKRVAKSERKITALEDIAGDAGKDIAESKTESKNLIESNDSRKEGFQTNALQKEGFFCEFCENSKLQRIRKKYYQGANAILTIYHCPICDLEFKFDDAGNSIPVARNKGTLERAGQRRKERAARR